MLVLLVIYVVSMVSILLPYTLLDIKEKEELASSFDNDVKVVTKTIWFTALCPIVNTFFVISGIYAYLKKKRGEDESE